MIRFYIFPSWTLFGKRWFFRATGRNGEPILQSEGYRNFADAEKTVELIQSKAADAKVIIEGESR